MSNPETAENHTIGPRVRQPEPPSEPLRVTLAGGPVFAGGSRADDRDVIAVITENAFAIIEHLKRSLL